MSLKNSSELHFGRRASLDVICYTYYNGNYTGLNIDWNIVYAINGLAVHIL